MENIKIEIPGHIVKTHSREKIKEAVEAYRDAMTGEDRKSYVYLFNNPIKGTFGLESICAKIEEINWREDGEYLTVDAVIEPCGGKGDLLKEMWEIDRRLVGFGFLAHIKQGEFTFSSTHVYKAA